MEVYLHLVDVGNYSKYKVAMLQYLCLIKLNYVMLQYLCLIKLNQH